MKLSPDLKEEEIIYYSFEIINVDESKNGTPSNGIPSFKTVEFLNRIMNNLQNFYLIAQSFSIQEESLLKYDYETGFKNQIYMINRVNLVMICLDYLDSLLTKGRIKENKKFIKKMRIQEFLLMILKLIDTLVFYIC